MMALQMLLLRVELAGLSFVLGGTAETVLPWLRRAAQQAEVSNHHRLRPLPVTPVQLAERWTFLARQPACKTDAAAESVPDGAAGRQGV